MTRIAYAQPLGCNVMRSPRAVAFLFSWAAITPLPTDGQGLKPECPQYATPGTTQTPELWADQCFEAVNGRSPDPSHPGEVDSLWRDIDLDGQPERLEVRGTGNASKAIYVFRPTPAGYAYLGMLNAHPSFTVSLEDGEPTISYVHRFGTDHLEVRRIRYLENEFVEIGSERVR